MTNEKEILALLYVKNSGKFGTLQTIGVSVNYDLETVKKEEVQKDLICIATIAGSKIRSTSVVASNAPFPHGFVDLFFENDVLVRYSFTATKATGYKDWRLYLTDAESYFREGNDTLEILVAKPESTPGVYAVQDFAKETEKMEVCERDKVEIANVVEKLFK
jgi:hypothetical protein